MRRRIVWRYGPHCKCRGTRNNNRKIHTLQAAQRRAASSRSQTSAKPAAASPSGDVGRAILPQLRRENRTTVVHANAGAGEPRKSGRSLLLSPTNRILASASATAAGQDSKRARPEAIRLVPTRRPHVNVDRACHHLEACIDKLLAARKGIGVEAVGPQEGAPRTNETCRRGCE